MIENSQPSFSQEPGSEDVGSLDAKYSEVEPAERLAENIKTKEELWVELEELIADMAVPALRRFDLGWLGRNLGVYNQDHPNFGTAITVIKSLMRIQNQ